MAAYENRRASRLEPVEHSPRFASTGRRLKNDCHLSGSGVGKARRKMSERLEKKKETTKRMVRHTREQRDEGAMISQRRRITCRGAPSRNARKIVPPPELFYYSRMTYKGTHSNSASKRILRRWLEKMAQGLLLRDLILYLICVLWTTNTIRNVEIDNRNK